LLQLLLAIVALFNLILRNEYASQVEVIACQMVGSPVSVVRLSACVVDAICSRYVYLHVWDRVCLGSGVGSRSRGLERPTSLRGSSASQRRLIRECGLSLVVQVMR